MRILLTNDDGIDARGLATLAEAAAGMGSLVWIAPVAQLSGCSHRVTTSSPICVVRHDDDRWAIHGTPADCVRVALAKLAPDVDCVLAGMNHGGNLGADVFHSGTVAAVREAALHGRRAIALSHYRKRDREIDWERARRWMRQVLLDLLAQPALPGIFWNVNLPHLSPHDEEPRVIHCPLEVGPLPLMFREEGDCLHYEGNYQERARRKGSDVDVCFGGNIAVTRMTIAAGDSPF